MAYETRFGQMVRKYRGHHPDMTNVKTPWTKKADEEKARLKGVKGKNCNRTACQKPGAVWWNRGSLSWYCRDCADAINEWAADDPLLAIDMEAAVEFALPDLLERIDYGWEFPDAVKGIARRHRVDLDRLSKAYDKHCMEAG